LPSAFAGKLAGSVEDGEVEEVVTVGAGDAVIVTGDVVDAGGGVATAIGNVGMVPGRNRCIPITLVNAGDRVAAWFEACDAGIVELITRPLDITVFDEELISRA